MTTTEAPAPDAPHTVWAPNAPAARIALADFLARRGLGERLRFLHTAFGTRLGSNDAAEAWLQLTVRCAASGRGDDLERLLREFLLLAPEHPKSGALYDTLMRQPAEPLGAGALVYLITSCRRYFDKAMRLHAELARRGANARVVVGDPALDVARHDGAVVTVPVADTYEALPHKLLEGLTAVTQRHGPVAVLKLDDDAWPSAGFDPAATAALAARQPYSGSAVYTTTSHIDRCWHYGKTSQPAPPYLKRFRGPYARGAFYLLSPSSVALLVREWTHYAGEFEGDLYEDKMVGDCLRRHGVTVTDTPEAALGLGFDAAERVVRLDGPRPVGPRIDAMETA